MPATCLRSSCMRLGKCYAVPAIRPRKLLYQPRKLPGQRMVLRMCYTMSGTELAYGAMRYLREVRPKQLEALGGAVRAISLRKCYAKSGTEIAYGAGSAISLRLGYAVSGTEIPSVMSGPALAPRATRR
eukprot:3940645-Rhodomonas_salina.2